MPRTIPSRSALVAFEAAARHQSFTSAAAELTLTESAISRQVAALENQLKLKLFNRVRKRVTLTKAGLLYSKQVRKSLVQIEQDMTNIMAHGGIREILELAVLPTFCSQWLIPRLGVFYNQYPNMTINTSARSVMFLIKETPFDAAIHYGSPVWPGTVADYLFKEEVVAVCRPELIVTKQLDQVENISNCSLLHLTSRPNSWRDWFERAGLAGINAMHGSRHEHFSILISAACAGLGIALIPRYLITEELERKQLAIAFDLPQPSNDAYYLVYPEENLSSSALKQFRGWLLEEVKNFQGN
ncbi:MAG: LysR family transcriptional regulator [Thermodesulfobacteriota bacterium]|nr:LysR family transcriptional regulator [Thermodesulfobacteriota bacterium]